METWIYLIKDLDTGYTKIGQSINPLERFKTLKKQATLLPRPNNFELIDAFYGQSRDEANLHCIFKQQRRRGEWFELTDEMLDCIQEKYFYNNRSLKKGYSQEEFDEEQLLIKRQPAVNADWVDVLDCLDIGV